MGEMELYKNDRISLKNLNEFSVMVLHISFMQKWVHQNATDLDTPYYIMDIWMNRLG